MKLRTFIAAAAIAALPLAASAATFVVPAAGTGPGDAGSHWQSELTLHSAAPRITTVDVTLHQGTTVLGPITITLQPRETRSIDDIVKNEFGLEAGTGALVVTASDRDARGLAITSRTTNVAPNGAEFGQDIPSRSQATSPRSPARHRSSTSASTSASTRSRTRRCSGSFCAQLARLRSR